jgi:hypothetical protein
MSERGAPGVPREAPSPERRRVVVQALMGDAEVAQLDALADRLAMTRSAVVRLALKELAAKLRNA